MTNKHIFTFKMMITILQCSFSNLKVSNLKSEPILQDPDGNVPVTIRHFTEQKLDRTAPFPIGLYEYHQIKYICIRTSPLFQYNTTLQTQRRRTTVRSYFILIGFYTIHFRSSTINIHRAISIFKVYIST